MRSRVTPDFRRRLSHLPPAKRDQAARAFALWSSDPHHPSLQFKRVGSAEPVYSVRIGLGHRALGLRTDDQIVWFWIGSHAEYDGLLKRL